MLISKHNIKKGNVIMFSNYSPAEKIVMPVALIVIIVTGVFLGSILRKKSDKIKNIPLTIIAVTLIVLEVIKQVRAVVTNSWSPWLLPVHFCSALIFWFAFAQFSKGELKQTGYACALSAGVLMTVMFYLNPSSIIGDSCSNPLLDFGTFHTFTFHFLAVTYTIWLMCLNLYKPKFKHVWQVTLFFVFYFILIVSCAYIFNTNYTNALYSNIPFMESFRLNAGQVWYTIAMIAFGLGAVSGFTTLYCLLYKGLNKLRKR